MQHAGYHMVGVFNLLNLNDVRCEKMQHVKKTIFPLSLFYDAKWPPFQTDHKCVSLHTGGS